MLGVDDETEVLLRLADENPANTNLDLDEEGWGQLIDVELTSDAPEDSAAMTGREDISSSPHAGIGGSPHAATAVAYMHNISLAATMAVQCGSPHAHNIHSCHDDLARTHTISSAGMMAVCKTFPVSPHTASAVACVHTLPSAATMALAMAVCTTFHVRPHTATTVAHKYIRFWPTDGLQDPKIHSSSLKVNHKFTRMEIKQLISQKKSRKYAQWFLIRGIAVAHLWEKVTTVAHVQTVQQPIHQTACTAINMPRTSRAAHIAGRSSSGVGGDSCYNIITFRRIFPTGSRQGSKGVGPELLTFIRHLMWRNLANFLLWGDNIVLGSTRVGQKPTL
ncbi:hypothetical protein FIBSPDRAFT_894008 [Athelia psychrophila]|uniref:Uncharacterized protein n=1 Tax=Athelia psychrophila TaxID=1759441 RepID=A0A166GF42_9AGAM|nr:hypothetical protein FIBSPDRAFT_894008 [Fibularhizoctonia sp. CBS 109695]